MPIVIEDLGPAALEVKVSGILQRGDYERFVPEAERRIETHGHVNLLIDVADLDGATPPALWEDAKFDAKHFSDVPRCALVGSDRSNKQRWLAALGRPFTSAEIECFDEAELSAARTWVRGVDVPSPETGYTV